MLSEGDVVDVDGFVEEDLGLLLELVGVLGGEVVDGGGLGAALVDLGVAIKVGLEALGDVFALGDDAHARGEVFQDLRHEQGVMGAAEDDGVDLGIFTHDLIDAFLDEVVGSRGVGFVVLDEGHPEGAGDARDLEVGVELVDLEIVALALDGALGGKDAHMTRFRQAADDLGGGADDAEDAALGVDLRQVVLLDGAQGLGGGGVTAEDDEVAAHLEELQHGLARKLIDHVERTWSIGCAGVVAEIKVVVFGKQLADAMQDGEAAVAAVENANGTPGHFCKDVVTNSVMSSPMAGLMKGRAFWSVSTMKA